MRTDIEEEEPYVSGSFDKDEHETAMSVMAAGARESFLCFLHYMWPQIEGQTYIIGALHEELARIVQDTFDGKINPHQVVSVPPQHGKSRMLSVRAAAWLIGRSPGIHIALTGFSGSLLGDFINEIRAIMEMDRYNQVFPDIKARRGRNRAHDVLFSNGSNLQGRSCGSKLTGRKVDWLVVDDAHAGREEAESAHQRRKVSRWFYADCMSRISAKAKIFVVATRWHPEDLIGNLTSADGRRALEDAGFSNWVFQSTNFPAIATEKDKLGREVGDALFPEQRPIEFLRGVKAIQPAYEWQSQYMGHPMTASGEQVDVGNIKRISMDLVPRDIEWVRGWDLAITEDQQADSTAGALCALRSEWIDAQEYSLEEKKMVSKRKKIEYLYIIHMKKGQKAWAAMRQMVLDTSRDDRANNGVTRIGIEGVAGFDAVYSDVKQDLLGEVNVEKKNPKRGGKLLRAQPWLNLIEAGRVFMVRAPWNIDFINELTLFPDGNHDDQVDAVSIAYEMLAKRDMLLIA
jgi:predicted phage terminase large subunit-like protein